MKCDCGRYILGTSVRCKSCVKRGEWKAGVFDNMAARTAATPAESRLAAMRELISSGTSVNRAALLIYRKGLGRSQGANRKLWSQYTGKRRCFVVDYEGTPTDKGWPVLRRVAG